MRKSVLRYLLYLLLCRWDLKELRKLVWKKRSFRMRLQHFYSQGILYLHPINLLNRGLLKGQIVQVSINYMRAKNEVSQDRLLVIESMNSLTLDEFMLGNGDRFNIFGASDSSASASIKYITPYSALPRFHRQLAKPDSVRVSPIKQYGTKLNENFGESLQTYLKRPRIIYKGDIIILETKHALVYERATRAVKLDFFGESPCILDNTCSFYETAIISGAIPYAGLLMPHFTVSQRMREILQRMKSLYWAYEATHMNPLVFLLSGACGSGKRLLAERLAILTHQSFINSSCYDTWSDVSAQAEQKLKHLLERARSYQPCVLYISYVDILGFDSNSTEPDHRVIKTLSHFLNEIGNVTIILGCRSEQLTDIPNIIKSFSLYDFNLPHLNEIDRKHILSQFLTEDDADICARNTSGFSMAELFSLMEDIEFCRNNGYSKPEEIVEKAIDKRNIEFADSIGATKIPTVSWNDVGGLEDTKQLVIESIEANLHGDDSLRRSGIILFGPPGCGKTLIAKAVATEFKIAFLSVKGPELLNKYVGQSEENLRKIFNRARQASPCVIFFDEIDSLAPNRGRNGDSGGVMDRIVSQLLSEMDDLLSDVQCKVFVIAATNRADLLDPSLLTPGRFDKVVNVSPGTSVNAKEKILSAVCRKIKLNVDVNLREIAEKCPKIMSGAELYSIVSTATMAAVRDEVRQIDTGKIAMSNARVLVSRSHLLSALDTIRERTALR